MTQRLPLQSRLIMIGELIRRPQTSGRILVEELEFVPKKCVKVCVNMMTRRENLKLFPHRFYESFLPLLVGVGAAGPGEKKTVINNC